ncbi:G-protein coupled receptor 83-like [Mya arenaria]|uniref:G-protein coupled receptor 83-like n=1 Tax=Mya arenaria TaxID=6604 RepID=UPI0022E86FB2|nr:G-protein coupled receptor 83-like [Mya arenaria]
MAFLDDIEKLIYGDDNTTGIPRIQDLLQFANESRNVSYHQEELDDEESNVFWRVFLILAYSIIIAISLFGNTLVCHVIFKNKRMRTVTNIFIANLAVSDLLLTCINVPFNIARNLLENWPFGSVMCHLMNFSLMVSSYVSTFTLLGIALDRQQVLMYPLSPRMSKPIGIVVITIIWMVAIGLSLPFGLFNKVQTVDFFFKKVKRCTSDFPTPRDKWEKYLTISTFFLQFIIPLTVIGITYGRIVRKLWVRTHVGAVTQNQHVSQQKAKRKSIKMLIAVVVVFALCWMPLNLYQVLADFNPDHFSSTSFFICHWIAISSTCYNPFIYCWLNESFRNEVKSRFKCCFAKPKRVQPGITIDCMLFRSDCSYNRSISKNNLSNRRTLASNRPNALYKHSNDISTTNQSEELFLSPNDGTPVSDISVSGATLSGALETVLEFPEQYMTENIEHCITENDSEQTEFWGQMSTGSC